MSEFMRYLVSWALPLRCPSPPKLPAVGKYMWPTGSMSFVLHGHIDLTGNDPNTLVTFSYLWLLIKIKPIYPADWHGGEMNTWINESLWLTSPTFAISCFTARSLCSARSAVQLWDRSRKTQKEEANRKAIILGLNVCAIELIKRQRNKSLLDWPGWLWI